MRVLVITLETWQDTNNGGNTLSNIFDNSGFEFANICCRPGEPRNTLCKKYFQMTDIDVIKSSFGHKPIGRSFILAESQDEKKEIKASNSNKNFYRFFHLHRLGIFYIASDLLWNTSNWKNAKLTKFIDDFNPDIIFAPCYGNIFAQRLTRFVADYTNKKVISYISDDFYTLKQFNLSPYFWIKRFIVRHQVRKTFRYYSLVYTMTEIQKEQCENDFGANMKILIKSVSSDQIPDVKSLNIPIKMIYAGNIFYNRWKTLAKVVEALKEINKDEIKIQLHIYTGNEINDKILKLLNAGSSSIVHGSVGQQELKAIYSNSDIALHVESFDLKCKLSTRMSFSTKIVDCLSSGCAVMAICDEKQGGYQYLKQNGAAICVSNVNDIEGTLKLIVKNPDYVMEYKKKAIECCRNNLNKNNNERMIKEDFNTVYNEKD